MAVKYSQIRDYLKTYLAGLGYDPLPTFDPGPGADSNALDRSPDRLVLLTFGSGAGLSQEYAIDNPALYVRTVGGQADYDDSQQLSQDVDKGLLKLDHSQFVNGIWITSVQRAGGNPTLLLKDDGDRYHFTCTYIIGAKAGLDDD
jgi:hypothetical protein